MHVGKYNVESELANGPSCLTFGQIVLTDAKGERKHTAIANGEEPPVCWVTAPSSSLIWGAGEQDGLSRFYGDTFRRDCGDAALEELQACIYQGQHHVQPSVGAETIRLSLEMDETAKCQDPQTPANISRQSPGT